MAKAQSSSPKQPVKPSKWTQNSPRFLWSFPSWWLNQPIWKICASQNGSWIPQIGMNTKKYLSCHHLVSKTRNWVCDRPTIFTGFFLFNDGKIYQNNFVCDWLLENGILIESLMKQSLYNWLGFDHPPLYNPTKRGFWSLLTYHRDAGLPKGWGKFRFGCKPLREFTSRMVTRWLDYPRNIHPTNS